jgi:hypothetical protein
MDRPLIRLSLAPILNIYAEVEIELLEVEEIRARYRTPLPSPDWRPSDWATSLGLAWKQNNMAYGISEIECFRVKSMNNAAAQMLNNRKLYNSTPP